MSIWSLIRGGWRTHGPNAVIAAGFDSRDSDSDITVTRELALRLSAVHACLSIRAETIGTLPIHIRDKDKKVLTDHPLYNVLHNSPNAMQTPIEFKSLSTAAVDMDGNHFSRVVRRESDRKVIALEPFDDAQHMSIEPARVGWRYKYGDDYYAPEDILHFKGFSTNRHMGLPRIELGRHILAAQLSANKAALSSFQQSMKVGGFFEVDRNMTDAEYAQWERILERYARPENNGKMMTLLRGLKPISGAPFRLSPNDTQLLASRGFGIEEICRLFNVPPQLIHQTDKASSWASSIENINLFFVCYSIMPTIVRMEQRLEKTLLSAVDRGKGIEIRFSLQGLMRGDMKTRMQFYASALQNGWMSRNEVRDLEERGEIEGGDEYTVQTNMTAVANTGEGGKDEAQDANAAV
jgi:HK97 family phage portal protein